MKKKITRRDFIKKSGIGAGFAGIAGTKDIGREPISDVKSEIPKRKLGRTGMTVSALGFGAGSRYLIPDERTSEKIIQYAVKLGINFYDTSITYGEWKSEIRLGKYLTPDYRDKIYLSTKTDALTYDVIMQDIETSLNNLKTDFLDLYSFHSVDDMEKMERISGKNGALKGVLKLKKEGVIKNFGVSFHIWNEATNEAVKRFNPDVVLCPLNAARNAGGGSLKKKADSLEENLIPYAKKNNIGIAAIKTTGQNSLIGNVTGQDLVRYTMSIPDVGTVLVGIDSFGTLESCVEIAKEQPLAPAEMDTITEKLAYDPNMHKIPYLQSGYVDDGSVA